MFPLNEKKLKVLNRSVFLLSTTTSFGTFQWRLYSTQISLSLLQQPFFKEKNHCSEVLDFRYIVFFKLYGIP